MALGVDPPASTNPFGDPDEEVEEEDEEKRKLPTVAPSPSTTVLPFIRVPILLVCTVVTFVLMIGGTAFTALSFPPQAKDGNVRVHVDGDYKLLGPLMLTSGCFLLIVNVVLCAILTREAYYSSRLVQPAGNAWNEHRTQPVSLVGGPFYIATAGPGIPAATLAPFHSSPWVYPNAPMAETSDFWKKANNNPRAVTATIARHEQPPFNPDMSTEGA